jgi:hypothetical protein
MAALILLSYTLIRVLVLPTVERQYAFVGLLIELNINAQTIMLALAAGITTAGVDWLIRSHPSHQAGSSTYEHLIVPGLASLALGAILVRLPEGPFLWLGLVIGALLLMGTFLAEYIVSDLDDPRYDVARVLLTSLAYLLIIGVFFSLRVAHLRAFFTIPSAFLASAAVSWRIQVLHSGEGTTAWLYAGIAGWITAQSAWALHYWPLPPFKFALLLGLIVYLLNGLLEMHRSREISPGRLLEVGLVSSLGLIAVMLLA